MRREVVGGRTVTVHERGDGVRRRYRDSLDSSRFLYPRKGLVHHPRAWFLSEGPLRRPIFGVYALAAFAEDMMWRARHAKKGMKPAFEDAARYFAETRRALQNVLSSYRIDRRLTSAQTRKLRALVGRLVEGARELVGKMKKVSETP